MTNEIRLYMFQTGVLKCKENNIKMNAPLNDYEIPVPWYLITHPKGHIIIDGGNAVECANNPREHWGDIVDIYWPEMTEEEGVENVIESLGIAKEDIKYVLQSHLHLDHTGATGRFPNATHVVQRKEYEYAYTADWFAAGGYIRADFDKPDINWHFINIENNEIYDIHGDGVVQMIPTPGHSPGHCSFLINLPEDGSIVLAVDAAYTVEHLEDKALPGFLASAVDAVRSVAKLREIAKVNNAIVVTGHDPDAWGNFKKGPNQYYK